MAYFNDNENEINPDLHPKPQLCLSCAKNDEINEEIVCNLTRLDQKNSDDFICYAYETISNK